LGLRAVPGGDPLGERKKVRQRGITVAEVCDWYLKQAEAGYIVGRRGKPVKASTLAMDRSRIETHVKPLLGRRAVAALTTADVEAMQSSIVARKARAAQAEPPPEEQDRTTAEAEGAARRKRKRRPRGGQATGGPGVAARTVGMLQAILEHAVRHHVVAGNPAKGVRKLAGQRRRKRLELADIRKLGETLREAELDGSENRIPLSAIRFLLLSGFRRQEALGLKPTWILSSGAGIDFPDTKTDSQIRPIGKAALGLLRAIAKSDAEWVFPAERGDGHYVGLPKVLARVCARAKLPRTTPQGLRSTFASVAGDLGFSELTIDALLGHGKSGAGGYVHLDSVLIAAADRVAGVIADALDGKPSAEVVPLTAQAG
jgi:integrase